MTDYNEEYKIAKFPIDFEKKYLKHICEDENLTPSRAMAHYNRDYNFQEFCRGVAGKELKIKLDGSYDCFELEDDNWCIPLSILEILD